MADRVGLIKLFRHIYLILMEMSSLRVNLLCRLQLLYACNSYNNGTKELTVYNKPPFVFYCTVGNVWIFSATRQVFSIIIDNRDEC